LRKLVVCNCLIACNLFSYSVSSAQNPSRLAPPLAEQSVELQPLTLADSTGWSGSETTAAVAEETPPPADPQSNGNGNGNGNANGSGNTSTAAPAATTGNTSAAAPATTTYVFPTSAQMNAYWIRNMLGPTPFLGATLSASWNTWVNLTPDEWGHRAGWGKRFGTSFLDIGMNQTALVLLSRAMGQDPMYYRCDCSGVGARTGHAIKMSFMSRNRSGDNTFAPAKIVSHFVGPIVTRNTLYPSSFDSSDGARSGAYYLLGSIGWNIVREFIWRK
jgi:hypothetical protein